MADFIKLNGIAVRTTGMYQRTVRHSDATPLAEIELVIIIRGSMAHRSLKQLLSTERIHVDLTKGQTSESFESTIENVQVSSSGAGEAAAYRFDITLRETPESAIARGADRSERDEEKPNSPAGQHRYTQADVVDDNPDAPLDLSKVTVSADSSVWATALKQLKAPAGTAVAAPPEPPLTSIERAGVEAILVNLRMDALIDRLEAANLVRRADIDYFFMGLVKERFVAEATPVIGESAAKQAERDLLG